MVEGDRIGTERKMKVNLREYKRVFSLVLLEFEMKRKMEVHRKRNGGSAYIGSDIRECSLDEKVLSIKFIKNLKNIYG